MWNISQPVDEILDDYFLKAYGTASSYMKQYYELLETSFMNRQLRTKIHWGAGSVASYYTSDTLRAAGKLLDAAEQATTDPAEKARIKHEKFALQYTTLTVKFFKSCQELSDMGLIVRTRHYIPKAPAREPSLKDIRRKIIDTIDLRDRLLSFITQHESPDSFISMLSHQDKTFHWMASLDEYVNIFINNAGQENTQTLPVKWKFHTDPDKMSTQQKWQSEQFDDSDWKWIRTDLFWENQGYDQYDGVAWYRLQYRIENPGNGKVLLRFGAIDEACDLFINGKLIGSYDYDHKENPDGWKVPVKFDITESIHSGNNLFAVKVYDSSYNGGLWKRVYLITESNTTNSKPILLEPFTDTNWLKKHPAQGAGLPLCSTEITNDPIKPDRNCLHVQGNGGKETVSFHWPELPVNDQQLYYLSMQVLHGSRIGIKNDYTTLPSIRIIPYNANGKVTAEPKQYEWIKCNVNTTNPDTWNLTSRIFRLPVDTIKITVTLFSPTTGEYWFKDLQIKTL
jgi:hypothetical protein